MDALKNFAAKASGGSSSTTNTNTANTANAGQKEDYGDKGKLPPTSSPSLLPPASPFSSYPVFLSLTAQLPTQHSTSSPRSPATPWTATPPRRSPTARGPRTRRQRARRSTPSTRTRVSCGQWRESECFVLEDRQHGRHHRRPTGWSRGGGRLF